MDPRYKILSLFLHDARAGEPMRVKKSRNFVKFPHVHGNSRRPTRHEPVPAAHARPAPPAPPDGRGSDGIAETVVEHHFRCRLSEVPRRIPGAGRGSSRFGPRPGH